MKRITIAPRINYKEKIQDLGFYFDDNYWLENAYYEFSKKQIEEFEKATNICYQMYVNAVEYIIKNDLWDELHIPRYIVPTLINSWERDELSLYGRFDFTFVNDQIKLLEFNADTPTSLFEASVVQWEWKEELFPKNDQFNSLHEALIQSWVDILKEYDSERVDFCCISDNLEDYTTTSYILSTAAEAGLNTAIYDIEDIDCQDDLFYNKSDQHIDFLFKLYPYEWMFNEEFGKSIPNCKTTFIEPLWKAIMSNKYMLVILSKLFPTSPYILKTDTNPLISGNYCKKPIYSREGANVSLYKNGILDCETDGEYGEEGFIYQELVEIEPQNGKYPIVGSWVIGGESCGIGIRETDCKITNNMSYFIPHIITNDIKDLKQIN
jgi:glutathionylspermidine synthase